MNNNRAVLKRVKTRYSPQFKDQVSERVVKEGVPQVAKELGLTESLLYSWRTQKQRGGDRLENQKLQQAELSRLKRENENLAEENAFLKKAAAAYFAKESK
nr:transposase [Legionella brunensis]